MRPIASILIVLAATLLGGCLEIETVTEVRPDGTLTRTITIVGDSGSIAADDIPLPLDDSWTRTEDTAADGKRKLTATRVFADAEELTAALRGTPGKSMTVEVTLEKEFDWFYTRHVYTETWKQYDPYRAVPITDYLAPSEIELIRQHAVSDMPYGSRGDSLAVKDAGERFEQWRLRNAFERYWQEFRSGVELLGDSILTPALAEQWKDSVAVLAIPILDQGSTDSIPAAFARLLPASPTERAFALNAEGFDAFRQKQSFEERVWTPTYATKVRMPGLLVETNARAIEGNTASWSDYIGMCYVGDYTMRAVSRTANWWMVAVSGVLLFALVLLLVLSLLRRRHSVPGLSV